jgi:hypothetical protein
MEGNVAEGAEGSTAAACVNGVSSVGNIVCISINENRKVCAIRFAVYSEVALLTQRHPHARIDPNIVFGAEFIELRLVGRVTNIKCWRWRCGGNELSNGSGVRVAQEHLALNRNHSLEWDRKSLFREFEFTVAI